MGWFTPSYSSSSSHRRSSSSSYRRRPRDGYIQRMIQQLRRFLRDLIAYARRNPMKVVMMVIMPLITGGALTGILRRFGIRLPPGMARMFGGGGREFDRFSGRSSGPLDNFASSGGLQGLMKIASHFM